MRAKHDIVLKGAGKVSMEEIVNWAGKDKECNVEMKGNVIVSSTPVSQKGRGRSTSESVVDKGQTKLTDFAVSGPYR